MVNKISMVSHIVMLWASCHTPCLIFSTSTSDTKLSSAREMANRRAPAWAEWPLPSTLPSMSNRLSMPTKCRGNNSCSLRERKEWNVGRTELRTCFSLLDCSSFQHLYEWHSCKSPIEDCIVIFRQSDNPATVRTIERTRCKRVQSLAGRPTVLTQSNTPLLLQLGLCEADGVIRAGSRPHADSAESPAHSSV